MENYKVKVNSEAESKEAQELFIQLGYKEPAQGLFGGVGIKSIQARDDMDLTWGNDHGGISSEFKEITLPQLKDMVVLKRNNPKDSTHYRGDGKEYFQTHDKERHYHFQDGEWVLSTWMNYQLLPQLKPITKEPIMKEFLAKDESGSYFLFNSEYPKASEWIEVPEGALMLIHHPNGREVWSYSDSKVNPLNTVLWQRHTQPEALPFIDDEPKYDREETLNDKVASAEVARQEFIGDQPTAFDTQISGDHYKLLPIQPMKFALANGLDYAQGNVIKYVIRHASKGGKEDLLKAIHNIELMIEHYYG